MSGRPSDEESERYGMEEIPVTLCISDGKMSAESTSGPKSGSIELAVNGTSVTLELGGHVLFSGYLPLQKVDDELVIQFEEEPLRRLDLTDEEGEIAGGGRQVQCTVLGNGTAILNLKSDERSDDPQSVKDKI